MSDTPLPENDYADRDIRMKPLVIFLGATLLITVLSIIGVKVLFNSYANEANTTMQQLDTWIEANRPTNAVVEGMGEAAEALRQLRIDEDARLHHYKWVSKDAGLVQIPIDRAMEVVVASGLPVRQPVKPTGSPDETPVEAGKRLFTELGCVVCHGGLPGALGPDMKGVFGHTVNLADGTQVVADEAYVRNSILDPLSQLVAGFVPVMPQFKGIVKDDQLDQLVAYIKSLATP